MIEQEKNGTNTGLIAFVIFYIGICLVPAGMALPVASVWGYRWLACIPIIIGALGLLSTQNDCSKYNHASLLTTREAWCLLLWACFSILSIIFSEHFAAALVRQVEWFVIVGFSLTLGIFLGNNPRFFTHIFLSISIGFMLIVFGFSAKWISLDNPHNFDWWWNPPFYFHMRHFNYHAVAAFTAAFFWFFSSVKRFDKYWWVACSQMIISITAISWSGARSGLLAVFLVSIFLFLTFLRGEKSKKIDLLLFVFIAIFFGLLASELLWTTSEGMGLSFAHGKSVDDISLDNFSSGRLGMWKQVLAYLYGHSMIFGFGPDGYMYMDGKPTNAVHPHSFYVQAVGDWGVGSIPFFVMIAMVILRTGKYIFYRKADPEYSAWIAAWVFVFGYLILGLFTGPFYHGWSLAFFSIIFAVLLTGSKKNHKITHLEYSRKLISSIFKSKYIWMLSLVVMMLHASVNIAQMGRIPDSPNSAKAKLVNVFPSHNVVIGGWYDQWIKNNPELTTEGLHWLQKHSFTNSAWKYYVEEGNYYRDKGEFSRAKALYDIALQKVPVNLKEADLMELESLREGLPSSVEWNE